MVLVRERRLSDWSGRIYRVYKRCAHDSKAPFYFGLGDCGPPGYRTTRPVYLLLFLLLPGKLCSAINNDHQSAYDGF